MGLIFLSLPLSSPQRNPPQQWRGTGDGIVVGRLGWCLQPTHPHNVDQCRETGLKRFLRMLKTQRKGWSHYCTSAGGGGLWATLLIWKGEFVFPSPLMSLKFLLRKTRLARLCAWEMDFIPFVLIPLVNDFYLSVMKYPFNISFHLNHLNRVVWVFLVLFTSSASHIQS